MRLEEATVLVVDDELELLEIFAAWLGRKGCRVLTATNGAEALDIVTKEKIDILVSDIRMPVMDGVELVRQINGMELYIPSVIFVSGFGDVHPREMYGLGVEALMEKPLSRKNLIRALEESLMEREKLWLTPLAGAMGQNISLNMESRADAEARCQFQLGRGGCNFLGDRPLEEEKTIDLCISFMQEGVSLKAQGTVRWVDKETAQAGMSFAYLEPECRDWVTAAMRAGACRSFIPPGRWVSPDRPLAEVDGSSLPATVPVPEAVT
jgi:CheY-like chemotaxis protein